MALIKERLGVDVIRTPGSKGQFDVLAGGRSVARRGGNRFTRSLGLGYPDLSTIVDELERLSAERQPRG